ncbi:MAG TPA: adenylate/guanylate cyclase domain-containing protein [Acidimicrobiales bacterium]|nr:adenylate/guanylate cyclase domain-containing protein [Acidimicrobiales bacterium]
MSDVEAIRSFLRDKGVSPADIDTAEAEGSLHLLVLEHLILPEPPVYTPVQVAERVGMPLERVRQYWRNLGFPDVPDDTVAFTDYDVDTLAVLGALMKHGMVDEDAAVLMARVIGSSMARIAEAEVTASPALAGRDADVERAQLLADTADTTIPALAGVLEYAWRRHLQAAARRATVWRADGDAGTSGASGAELAVGFVDLVGFTALSQQLSGPALADVVGRFEEVAFDVVVAGGGRVVKMIGDEAMFVVADPADAVRIGLDLSEAYAEEEGLSEVRVGIAYGSVLPREGDYFGPVVNLASRIVNIARPGSVVVSGAVSDAVPEGPDVAFKTLRPRYLKEIGRVPLAIAMRPAAERGAARGRTRRKDGVLNLLTDHQRERLEHARSHGAAFLSALSGADEEQ